MVFAPGVSGRCCWLHMDAEGRKISGHDLGSAPKYRSLHSGGDVWAGLGGAEAGEGGLLVSWKIKARPGSPFQLEGFCGSSRKCRESSREEEDQRSKAMDE